MCSPLWSVDRRHHLHDPTLEPGPPLHRSRLGQAVSRGWRRAFWRVSAKESTTRDTGVARCPEHGSIAGLAPNPYAALSHVHSGGWLFDGTALSRSTPAMSAPLPRPGAPGLRRVHGRAELPAAQGLRVTELRGDRGPAPQRRIDQLPGLVEGLQGSGAGSNRPTPACSRPSRTTTTRSSR